MSAEYLRARRARARAGGLCQWCLADAAGKSLCDACRNKRDSRYQAAREARVCTKCGKPSGGKWACAACRGHKPVRSVVRVGVDSSGETIVSQRKVASVREAAGGAVGRWFFTPHAVDQFLERHGKSTGCETREQALAWMINDSLAAKFAHVNRHTGDEVWVGIRPWRVRYTIGVIPPEYAGRVGAKRPVVTVLPPQRREQS